MTPELKKRAKLFKSKHLPLTKSLVLVGHMGCGKSTVGRRLAQVLGMRFVDADQAIEESAGQTIADMFDGERRVIKRLLEDGPIVLATGGGAMMNEETQRNIKNAAYAIWLKPTLEQLLARTTGRSHRPLLNTGDPKAVFRRLFRERDPVYKTADIVVRSGKDGPDVATAITLKRLSAFLEAQTQDASRQADPGTPADHGTPADMTPEPEKEARS
jgi:shikimate kinase